MHVQGRPSGLKIASAERGGEFQGIRESGADIGPEAAQDFRAEQKNYQCHGTGGTSQMGALADEQWIKKRRVGLD